MTIDMIAHLREKFGIAAPAAIHHKAPELEPAF